MKVLNEELFKIINDFILCDVRSIVESKYNYNFCIKYTNKKNICIIGTNLRGKGMARSFLEVILFVVSFNDRKRKELNFLYKNYENVFL